MPAPCLELKHLKTSKQYNGQNLINRYCFQWSNRKNLSNVIVCIELLDEAGNVVTTASIQLKKAKVMGQVDGRPTYNQSVWIQLDDIIRDSLPVTVRYYTLAGFEKRSDTVTVSMDGIKEDISIYG